MFKTHTNKIFIIFMLCLISPDLFANDGIVVWNLEANTGISEKDLNSICSYITTHVEISSGKKVISEGDIDTILDGQEKKQRCGGTDTYCMSEMAGALGVPYIVSGDLGFVGNMWLLNIRLIDVKSVVVINRISKKVKGSISEVVDIIPKTIAELFDDEAVENIKSKDDKIKKQKAIAGKDSNKFTNPLNYKPLDTFNFYKYSKFIALYSGVAFVSIGGYGFLEMKTYYENYKKTLSNNDEKQHEKWKTISDTSFIIGGSLLTGALIIWLIEPDKDISNQSLNIIPIKNNMFVSFTYGF